MLALSANDTASLARPIMYLVSTALFLGSVAVQVVLGRATAASVDSFIETESPIALRQLLCNIGPDGCNVKGAAPGAIIASPSTQDPNCRSLLPCIGPALADRRQTFTPGPGTVP